MLSVLNSVAAFLCRVLFFCLMGLLMLLVVCYTRGITTPQPFTHEEHSAFLDAMERFGQESTGNEWEKIAQVMGWLLISKNKFLFFFFPFSRLNFVPPADRGAEAIERFV